MSRSLPSADARVRYDHATAASPDSGMARVNRTLTWLAVGLGCLYALFALLAAGSELLAMLGLTASVEPRVLPPVFVVHALTGSVALAAGAVQLRLGLPRTPRRAHLHRLLGYHYVTAALSTSLLGPLLALRFDVGLAGSALFLIWAALWITTTLLAVNHARGRRIAAHRRWIARSYALAAVFVTFDFIRMALDGAGLGRTVVYPLALLISGTVNLAVAEAWLRRAASRTTRRGKVGTPS
jgi:uncharacterized membrane protein